MALKITANVRAATRKDEEAGVFVGYCPTLQLYSQGTDEGRARAALRGAVLLFLSTCIQNGVLDAALHDRGFTDVAPLPTKSPKEMMDEFIAIEHYDEAFEIDVPMYLLNQHEKERTAC